MIEELENNLMQVSIYELAHLVKKYVETNMSSDFDYLPLDSLGNSSKKDELLFYLASIELAKWK